MSSSKKKATMTLKDFHGGSIPSDLPLPSAPGVSVRPVGFDRQLSWGNSVARPDHRLRPASAGSARNLDEKTPFLSHASFIGRNFEEDERKPLDGVSGTRRTVGSDESILRAQASHVVEPKTDNLSGARVTGRAVSSPVSQTSSGSTGGSYAGRVSEVHNARLNNQTVSGSRSYGSNYPTMSGNAGQAVGGSYPNAWGIKKEPASMKEHVSPAWSAPDAETKLAHASALEKISSGRWNSKQHVHTLKDAEVLGPLENGTEIEYSANNMNNKRNYNMLEVVADPDYNDVALMIHAERSLAVNDGGGKLVPTYEKGRSTIHSDSYEGNISVTADGFHSPHTSGKSDGSELPAIFPSEPSERPKLKLLPRSKPLENVEPPLDYKQGYEQTNDHLHVVDTYVVQEPKNFTQPGFGGPVVGDQAPERPKLNLKPRSQSREQLEGKSEIRRGTVFGGARPREMVLKERRIEDDASSYESQSPLRVKEGTPKADAIMQVNPASYSQKGETIHNDQRIAKYSDSERTEPHRRNRQTETWRNNRDVEKHCNNQQPKQIPDNRPPSPETWRKAAEADAQPLRYGKAASAVELAQAFSKSVSDPTVVAEQFSGPSRGIPSRSQMPFSRLMGGPSPRAQINGY